MKTLKELRKIDLKLSSTEVYFSKVKDLPKRKLDLEVFLPTYNKNLQREKVWSLDQKRQLIMSIFLERFIPHICVMSLIDKEKSVSTYLDDILQIIDGKQRISTLLEFLNNEFTVELEGKEFFLKDLPDDYKHAFNHYEIKQQVCNEEYELKITDDEKIDWYERINFFGTPQDADHLKNIKENKQTIKGLISEKLKMENPEKLYDRIYKFLKQYAAKTKEGDYNSPDAYQLEACADLLKSGQKPSRCFSEWGSGGYKPYSSKTGQEEHDYLVKELYKIINK